MLAPRITGTEMEYSILVQQEPKDEATSLTKPAIENFLDKHLPPELKSLNYGYGSNGSRIYVDVGEHLEYATPEDTSFIGTVANEIAGEQIVHHMFDAARSAKKFHDFVINKRVVDDYGDTWGYHENYAVDASRVSISEESLALLGIHLATRGIFVGAGAITRVKSGRPRFVVSQKSTALDHDYFSGTTTKLKPVVNLRQEPLADKRIWNRVHVTCGDPNMSPWATLMKLGTTSLVLRLMEHGQHLDHLRVDSLKQLAGQVAVDATLKLPITLENGKTILPMEIQTELFTAAKDLGGLVELPTEEQVVLDMWEEACNDIAKDPSLLLDRVEWMRKLYTLEHYAAKPLHTFTSWSDPGIQDAERRWDTLRPNSASAKLREKLWQKWMPPAELIKERRATPPETRARIRGRFVEAALNNPSGGGRAQWNKLTVRNDVVDLGNPYQTESEEADKLISLLEAGQKVA